MYIIIRSLVYTIIRSFLYIIIRSPLYIIIRSLYIRYYNIVLIYKSILTHEHNIINVMFAIT